MPIPNEMKSVTMREIDFILIRPRIGRIPVARPSISQSRSSYSLHMDVFSSKPGKQLTSGFEGADRGLLVSC